MHTFYKGMKGVYVTNSSGQQLIVSANSGNTITGAIRDPNSLRMFRAKSFVASIYDLSLSEKNKAKRWRKAAGWNTAPAGLLLLIYKART